MEKVLSVLPNFTVLADNTEEYRSDLIGILRCFCEVVANVEHVDQYKITPESFWSGMNRLIDENINFVDLLKNNVKGEIPKNVLSELESWQDKFGVVTLIGDDCLLVKKPELIQEIMSSSKLSPHIYDQDGELLFFEDIDLKELTSVFEYELSHPIKIHRSSIKTFVMKDGNRTFVRKAKNAFSAFKSLYNNHPRINEQDLREILKHKKEEVTQDDISKYLEQIFDLGCRGIEIKKVPYFTINEAYSL